METTESIAVFAIAATLALSLLYHIFLEWSKPSLPSIMPSFLMNIYLIRKTAGLLLFGIIPAIVVSVLFSRDTAAFGLQWGETSDQWLWIPGVSIILVTLNVFNSKNMAIQAKYPELRLYKWNTFDVLGAAGGWILYLAGYEFMFRGLLLISCHNAFGLWPAITINLALYSSLHLQKGLKEAIAAIPFGALLCYLTIESQSIFPALILHSVQAISCELACIIRNPQMKISFKN